MGKSLKKERGITLVALVVTIIVIIILAGITITTSIKLVEQTKYTAFINEMQQVDESVRLLIAEKTTEITDLDEKIQLFDSTLQLNSDEINKLPTSAKNEIKYVRAMLEGTDIADTIPNYFENDALESEKEGNRIYYIDAEKVYIYDEKSASVYKVEPTIIWEVAMHGYKYGKLLVNQPGLLQKAQSKEEIPEGDYVIKSAKELKAFRDKVNSGDDFAGITVHLMSDIKLDEENWTPIGDYSAENNPKFSGIFKGHNHKITGLYIENDKDYQGFFGYNEGTIQDLIIEEGYIKGTAVISTGPTTIDNNTALLAKGSANIGAIAGANAGGTILNCTNKIPVEGNTLVGGITGYSWSLAGAEGKILNCVNEGNITSTGNGERKFVAGITSMSNSLIENCTNTGNVTTTGTTATSNHYLGGITTLNYSEIINCKNTGDIIHQGSGTHIFVGGVVSSNNKEVLDCTNEGKVTNNGTVTSTSGYLYTGGIAGQSTVTIKNSHNTGVVLSSGKGSTTYTGGIAGYNSSTGTINKCNNENEVLCTASGTNIHTAGVIGVNNGTINVAYNSGNIKTSGSGTYVYAGGITSYTNGVSLNVGNYGIITNSGKTTVSSGYLRAGGITGSVESGGIISNSYNRAKVECNGTGKADVGGITGLGYTSGKVNICYNTGTVSNTASSTKRTGVIAGYNNITITSCYYLPVGTMAGIASGTTSGTASKTDEYMKSREFMNVLNTLRGTVKDYLEWKPSDSYPIFKDNESEEDPTHLDSFDLFADFEKSGLTLDAYGFSKTATGTDWSWWASRSLGGGRESGQANWSMVITLDYNKIKEKISNPKELFTNFALIGKSGAKTTGSTTVVYTDGTTSVATTSTLTGYPNDTWISCPLTIKLEEKEIEKIEFRIWGYDTHYTWSVRKSY